MSVKVTYVLTLLGNLCPGISQLILGPYQNNERAKYFTLTNEIKEGMIFDIDIWQSNISIPKLKIVELLKSHQNIYKEVVINIKTKILEAL